MLPQNKPDRIRILFDDHRLVANAGLLLPATLARHLGLRELVDHHLEHLAVQAVDGTKVAANATRNRTYDAERGR